jgi:small subunit ribosomal protein S1
MVTATVVNKRKNSIIVEIGGAFTGIIAGREAVDALGTAKKLEVGDSVEAFVIEDENEEGHYVLSFRKAGKEKAWEGLKRLSGTREPVEVRVKEANKGGLMTDIFGIRAFIPVSQLAPEHYPRVNGANAGEILKRLQSIIGEKITVRIITVDKNEGKLILSEREAVAEKRGVALKKLKVGQKVKGVVSGIVNFGVFLLFDGHLEGLVHLSEIAWGHVADPAAHARIGEEKDAIVIGVEGDKISLSIKRLTPDPWKTLVEDLSIDSTVTGKVTKVTPFGAFVEIKKDVQGLIPLAEIKKSEGADGSSEIALEVGQEVTAKVTKVDVDEHRVGLTLVKEEEGEPKKKAKKKKEEE